MRPFPTLYTAPVAAGFPSPASDDVESRLDLNAHLVRRPAATFFVRAAGHSMVGAGIFDGDLLIVDRSVPPRDGDIVIAALHGDLTVKRLVAVGDAWLLRAANPAFPDFPLGEDGCEIWGVVAHSIHQHCRR